MAKKILAKLSKRGLPQNEAHLLTKSIKKMSNSKLIKSLPLIIALSACQGFSNLKTSDKKTDEASKKIVATFNGGEVTEKDVAYEIGKMAVKNEKLKNVTFDQLNSSQKEGLIKEIALKEISYKEAKKRGLHKDQDYQDALKVFESDLLQQKLLVDLVKKAQEEKNVKKNYDELAEKTKGKKDYKISYIALKTEKEADALYQLLVKNPSAFAAQAKKKSIDKETAKIGGAVGFVIEESLPASVVSEIKSIKKGEVSKPVLANENWLIVRFEDEREAEILPFEKAKEALAQSLAKKAVEDFVSQSIEKAKISISVK